MCNGATDSPSAKRSGDGTTQDQLMFGETLADKHARVRYRVNIHPGQIIGSTAIRAVFCTFMLAQWLTAQSGPPECRECAQSSLYCIFMICLHRSIHHLDIASPSGTN